MKTMLPWRQWLIGFLITAAFVSGMLLNQFLNGMCSGNQIF